MAPARALSSAAPPPVTGDSMAERRPGGPAGIRFNQWPVGGCQLAEPIPAAEPTRRPPTGPPTRRSVAHRPTARPPDDPTL